ncbi:MAG: phosphatidylserine/phosphatidylglycerophosphate/cardiolipin synthase family protein [Gammaproteobacteria bacterium]|nr:phosphatidylserine/phosphatidylglycerophosphate/cardiolipin synthase family protein [Gammaproteobacteria bacterium]
MSLQKLHPLSHYRFPWRENESFQLLVDGDRFFVEMLDAIEQSKEFIYFEMYLFESGVVADRFIDAMLQAGKRGVRVYLLLDDYGSLGLEYNDRARLQAGGISLCFYNPLHYGRLRRNLFRDHRKLLLVDGRLAYTGGAGITDSFDRLSHPKHFWHEAMVKIVGPCVSDWQVLFEESWSRWTDAIYYPPYNHAAEIDSPQLGRVAESRSFTHSEVIRSFVRQIRNARNHVWMATAYFVPSRKMCRALCKKSMEGVDVRLLLPGPHSDHPWARHMGRHYYDKLLRSGVRIFEYQPRFLHLKILLCDDWVSIGSSNVDRWNFRWNLEANQEVDNAVFANVVHEQFEHDFPDCNEISIGEWSKRSWWVRMTVAYWVWVMRLLTWISFNRKNKK